MSILMECFIVQKEIVKKYFYAWKYHDSNLIRNIFDVNASYIIENKKTEMRNINDIISYWERNKKRQIKLQVRWKIIGVKRNQILTNFDAYFYNKEIKQYNSVRGVISFSFNKEGRIIELSERYRKRVSAEIYSPLRYSRNKVFNKFNIIAE